MRFHGLPLLALVVAAAVTSVGCSAGEDEDVAPSDQALANDPTALRTYLADPSDFPLHVEVQPVGELARKGSVAVGDVYLEDRTRAEYTAARKDEDGIVRYTIALPQGRLPVVLHQELAATFANTKEELPKDYFQVTVRSVRGQTVATKMRVPTVNPMTANLAFKVNPGPALSEAPPTAK